MFFYFEITNGLLEPEFNENIYSYYVSIDNNIDKLEFDFKVDEATKINIVGNNDLKAGDNYVFIELEKNNIVKTYSFLVNKEETEAVFKPIEYVKLETDPKVNNTYLTPALIIGCLVLIILVFKILFSSSTKKRLH